VDVTVQLQLEDKTGAAGGDALFVRELFRGQLARSVLFRIQCLRTSFSKLAVTSSGVSPMCGEPAVNVVLYFSKSPAM